MIWLRNLIAYRLAADHGLTAKAINDALIKRPFVAPGSHDLFSQGWVSPHPHPVEFEVIHVIEGCALVMLRTDERILPASAIRREADIRIKRIEAEETRKVSRREAREIRERIAEELTPNALIKTSYQRALVDMRNNFVFVEASGASKAENLLSFLRESLGSLPTRLIDTKTSPQTAMTFWLENGAPESFELDADCELRFPGEGGAIAKFNRQTLDCDEIRQHLTTGKLATRLGMVWKARIAFQLTESLQLKRMQMLDVLQEELEEAGAEDQLALFESSLALTILELREFVPAVLESLGGEAA